MNRQMVRVAASLGLLLVGASPALAEQGPWGTPEDSAQCEKLDSEQCKAEIEKRAQACMKDPREAENLTKGAEWYPNDKAKATEWNLKFCRDVATNIIKRQWEEIAEKKQTDAARKAKVGGTEMPKADQHNAAVESAVAAAYKKAYPG